MKNLLSKLAVAAGLLLALAGCTNQDAYNAVRENRLHECQYLPPSEQEECVQRYDKTYEEYQRQREELLENGE
jgi:hypothetical protein